MANQEHLGILKQGVEAWNQWRKENPYVRPDLREEDLQGRDFNGINLHNANLSGANLGSVNSDEKLPKSAEIKIPRVRNVMLAHASASLKFPRSSVLGNVVPPLCVIYRSSYRPFTWSGSSPCVFREEGRGARGFAARSWNTPALRFSRRR
jgi:hypothetical protein